MGRKKLYTPEQAYQKIMERAKKYLQDNQKNRLYYSAKGNAKRRGIEFTISIEDIVIPEFCPYLGVRLTNTSNEGRVKTNASIDRKNRNKGYTKDNIQIISDLANRMKQDSTEEELVVFAENILKIYKDKVKE